MAERTGKGKDEWLVVEMAGSLYGWVVKREGSIEGKYDGTSVGWTTAR
jgi:hypothetical protein